MPVVWVPPLMQKLSGGQPQIRVTGDTVRQVIDNLDQAFPGFKDRLCEEGRIRHDIAVAVDGEVVSEGLRKKVADDSEVHFLPALAGG